MTKLVGFSGAFWTFSERVIQHVIKVLFTIVLARLLSPADYGVIGVLSVFTAFSTLLVNGGISHTIIWKENVSETDKSTLFLYTSGIGLVVYLFLSSGSEQIALFFDSANLAEISPIYFIAFFINGLSVVPEGMLYRELKFKRFLTLTFSPILCLVCSP